MPAMSCLEDQVPDPEQESDPQVITTSILATDPNQQNRHLSEILERQSSRAPSLQPRNGNFLRKSHDAACLEPPERAALELLTLPRLRTPRDNRASKGSGRGRKALDSSKHQKRHGLSACRPGSSFRGGDGAIRSHASNDLGDAAFTPAQGAGTLGPGPMVGHSGGEPFWTRGIT